MTPVLRWHIFCRVIDNYGDIGVCWRLAQQLQAMPATQQITLWVDDLQSFKQLCPQLDAQLIEQVQNGIVVRHWREPFAPVTAQEIGEVVIEAFGCELPPSYIEAMRAKPPIWLNLEYLSAEHWVADLHLRQSPVHGLRKTFFFPGFSDDSGGVLWDTALLRTAQQMDNLAARQALLAELGSVEIIAADQLLISLFGYENEALPALLNALKQGPSCRLLFPSGRLQPQLESWLGQSLPPATSIARGKLNIHKLPFMAQSQYDQLLASCHINFVRGEESFVRTQVLGKPFIWHIYPQQHDTHLKKLDAFLELYLASAPAQLSSLLYRVHRQWNGAAAVEGGIWGELMVLLPEWSAHAQRWREQLLARGDLASNIVQFCNNQV